MRRACSPRSSTPSSTPSPSRWPMRRCSRSGEARCMPASSRPWRGSPGSGWPSKSNGWPIMPCGARSGTRPWRTAGRPGPRPWRRSAHREAVGFFEQALSALPHLPETLDTRAQAIDLRLALRSALVPSGDFGRVLAYLREAEALAVALDDFTSAGTGFCLSVIPFQHHGRI